MQPNKESMTSVKQLVLPTSLKFDALDFKKGADFASKWKLELKVTVSGLVPGIFRNALLSIVTGYGKYIVEWPVEEDVKTKFGTKTDKQLEAMMKKLVETASEEMMKMEAVNTAVHVVLVDLMSTSSKDVLKTDVLYERNAKLTNPDPEVTWDAIMRTHVTARSGDNEFNRQKLGDTQLSRYLVMTQAKGESVTDYMERELNMRKSLFSFGHDVLKNIYGMNETKLTMKFIHGLDESRHGGLLCDFSNKIVPIPKTILAAAQLARDRVEMRSMKSNNSEFMKTLSIAEDMAYDEEVQPNDNNVLMSNGEVVDKKIILGKPELHPLMSYPTLPRDVWSKTSVEDKRAMNTHNRAILDAAEKLNKQKEDLKNKIQKEKEKKSRDHHSKPIATGHTATNRTYLTGNAECNALVDELEEEYLAGRNVILMVKDDASDYEEMVDLVSSTDSSSEDSIDQEIDEMFGKDYKPPCDERDREDRQNYLKYGYPELEETQTIAQNSYVNNFNNEEEYYFDDDGTESDDCSGTNNKTNRDVVTRKVVSISSSPKKEDCFHS